MSEIPGITPDGELRSIALPEAVLARTHGFAGRRWLFEHLDAWMAGSAPTLVLAGAPGTGKTAAAARLVQIHNGTAAQGEFPNLQDSLTYAHFCAARSPATLNPLTFVAALSGRLAVLHDEFRDALVATVRPGISVSGTAQVTSAASGATVAGTIVHVDMHGLSAVSAFDEAVAKPLRAAGERAPVRPVVLLDGLDEALAFGADNLVRLLGAVLGDLPAGLRFVLTTRARERRVLDHVGEPDVDLATDLPAGIDDVFAYGHARLTSLAEPQRSTAARTIAEKSEGVFLYAHHVLDDLLDGPGHGAAVLDHLPEGLTGVYREFLTREIAPDRLDERWRELYRPLLGLLAIARGEGLRVSHLSEAAGRMTGRPLARSAVVDALEGLAQFLDWPDARAPARIYHESFRDFLLDPESPFTVFGDEANRVLAELLADRWSDDDHALAYAPTHLVDAIAESADGTNRRRLTATLAALLGDPSFLEAKASRMGVDEVLADLRRFTDGPFGDDPRVADIAYLTNQEAHVLRGWDPDRHPAHFLQQLHNVAVQLGTSWVAERCRARLAALDRPWIELMCWSGRGSSALIRTLAGHTGGIAALAATPDAARIVSASYDRTVRVWNASDGRELGTLTGHLGSVTSVAVTPDGSRVVSGGWDRTLRAWRLDRGGEPVVVVGEPAPDALHSSVDVTPDGRRGFVTAGDLVAERTVHVWDLERRRELLSTPLGEYSTPQLSAAGDRMLASAPDGSLRLWDVDTGRELLSLGAMRPVLITQDWTRSVFVEPGVDPMAYEFFDLVDGRSLRPPVAIESPPAFYDASRFAGALSAVTADGRVGVARGWGFLAVWDMIGLQERTVVEAPKLSKNAVAVSSDGRWAACGVEALVELWDLADEPRRTVLHGHENHVNAVCFTSADRRLVSGSSDGVIKLWDVGAPAGATRGAGHGSPVEAIGFHGESGLVTAARDATVKAWSPDGHEAGSTLEYRGLPVTAAAFTPDARLVAFGTRAGILSVWDLRAKAVRLSLEGHAPVEEWLSPVALSADGRVAAAGVATPDLVANDTLRIWDLERAEVVARLGLFGGSITAVATLAGGERVVAGSTDGALRVVDVAQDAEVASMKLEGDGVRALAVVGDGPRAFVGTAKGSVRVIDLSTQAELLSLPAHRTAVHAVAVSSDGRRAVSSSTDRELKLWDLASGEELAAAMLDEVSNALAVEGDEVAVGGGGGGVARLRYVHGRAHLTA